MNSVIQWNEHFKKRLVSKGYHRSRKTLRRLQQFNSFLTIQSAIATIINSTELNSADNSKRD